MMTSSLESDLRRLVREVILEVLPEAASGGAHSEVRTVDIRSSDDLAKFVDEILRLAADRDELARYLAGTLRFVWGEGLQAREEAPPMRSGATADAISASSQPTGPVLHVETGAVTERFVSQALADGSRITLGKRAVVTPLARELARRNGLTLERQS